MLTWVAWMMVKSFILLKPAPIFDLNPMKKDIKELHIYIFPYWWPTASGICNMCWDTLLS